MDALIDQRIEDRENREEQPSLLCLNEDADGPDDGQPSLFRNSSPQSLIEEHRTRTRRDAQGNNRGLSPA